MKVLDISDPQVAVYFDSDKEYSYHHRILLHRIGAATWATLTPDCEFAVHDFAEEDIVVLERGADFPTEVQGSCYTFDPLDVSELSSFRRRAKLHAAILGEATELQEVVVTIWVVADAGDPRLGEAVPNRVVEGTGSFVSFGDRGVARIDGELRFVEKIPFGDVADFIARRRGSAGGLQNARAAP